MLTYGNYEYEILNDGTVKLTKYTGSASVVNVPSKIDGKDVTCLYYTFANNTNLTSVNIPDSITSLNYTFYGCTSLTSINIPDNVMYIKGGFRDCVKLTSVNLPNSVIVLIDAFTDCTSLTSINVPESVTDLSMAFQNCINLSNISIPENVTDLNSTFLNCTSLTNINIPDSVTNISGAFSGCTSLTSVNIPDSVTTMNGAFSGCTSLTSVNIPDSVTDIGYTFAGCESLISVNIPNSVTNISHAFYGCTSLASVNIPDGVTSMYYTFYGCTSLKSVSIPNNVIVLCCTFYGCTSLTSVNIPESVINIRYQTFENCTNLKSVTIPDSGTGIESTAFENCPNLTIRCYKGSYAETYAIENNIPYKIIGVSGRIIDVTLEKTTYAYTGSEIKPKVVAKYDDVTLTEGTDYTVSYKDNKKIGTGAVIVDFKGKYSGRKTLNFKITDGELPEEPDDSDSVLFTVVDIDNNSIKNCTYILGLAQGSTSNGIIILDDLKGIDVNEPLLVYADGYMPRQVYLDKYIGKGMSVDTIKLFKEDDQPHKLHSAYVTIDDTMHNCLDFKQQIALNTNADGFYKTDIVDEIKFDFYVIDNEDEVFQYYLYCTNKDDEDVLISQNSSGSFVLTKSDLIESDYYYVIVQSNNMEKTKTCLNLEVLKAKQSNIISVGFGENTKIRIPDDVPIVGGSELALFSFDSPIQLKLGTDGTVKASLGVKKYSTSNSNKDSFELARNYVNKVKSFSGKIGDDCKYSISTDFERWTSPSDLQLLDFMKNNRTTSKFLFSNNVNISLIGYGEGKLDSNGNVNINLGIVLSIEDKFNCEKQYYIGTYPILFTLSIANKVACSATIGFDSEDGINLTNGNIMLNTETTVEPGIAVGCKYANAGIYGTIKLKTQLMLLAENEEDKGFYYAALSGAVGASVSVGPFDAKVPVFSSDSDWVIYERYASANYSLGSLNAVNKMSLNSYMAKTERDLYNTANYSISENQEASAPTYNVISSDSVTDIVSDCDTGSSPQVVTCGDTTLMVYKDSDETLKYSVYNKNTNKWGSPANVDSNGSYDSGAYLYSDGEKIYVIYEESDMDLTDSTTLDEYTTTLEIAAAVFNSSTGKFENYTRLTNNNQIDSRPVITVANGIPTAAWITNADSNYFGTNSTNSIVYSSYSDNAWSEPAVLSENLNSITDMNIGTVNDKIYVVYVVDSDNDLTTADDRTLYAVDIDKNINYITEGSVDNIQFTAVPEVTENAVTWYENSEIMYSSEIGGESFNVLDDCNYTISSDYVIANNRIFYVSKNENNTQLNMVNCENGWNQPICVSTSNDGYYYEHLSAAGDMVLMINSKPDFANADSENMNVSSSIAAYIPAENTNIKVNGVTYDYEYAVPDYQVPIYIDATNTGTQNIEGISVEVYKGNTKVYGNEIDYSIRAGRNESIRILLDTDETLYTGDYKVTVKPLSGTDSDLSDNTAIFNFNMSDLEITSSEYYTSDGGTVSVCVQNNSYVPVADSVITVSDSEGNVIKTIEVPNVAAREIKVYEIPASELLESGVNESFVYLTITNDAQEYDTLNNSDVISVRRFSGITIDSCEISLSKTTAPYTGSAIKPRVTIKDGDKTLVSGTDYVIRYENNINVGTATIVISGKGTYCGTVKKTFEITESTTAISNCTITIPKSSYTYTGSAIKPKVTVKNGNITLTSGTDYVVRYVNNVEVGTASIVIAGRGNYTGNVTKTFEIAEATTDISSCTITIPQSSYTYTGSAIKPKVTIKNGSAVLTSGTDYVIRYANNINVGTASIVIAGRGSYSGSVTKTFEITQQTTDISNCTITISKSSYTYTGSAIKPKVTVKNGNTTLTSGTDYVVRYADNINVGTASIVIAGRGSYSGSVTKTFNITE